MSSRLSHLLPPSTTLWTTIFRFSYFLLPPSAAPLSTLKQCLHYDPDSKPCLTLHRLLKSFDRAFTKLEELDSKDDWRGIVKLLTASGTGKQSDILRKFDDALRENTARDQLLPQQLAQRQDTPEVLLPDPFKTSERRKTLVRALCKAYTQLGTKREMERLCEELLSMAGCEEDVEGLIGKGEALLVKQEWEEAVKAFEKAFDVSGRNRRDVSWFLYDSSKLFILQSRWQIQQRLQHAQKLLKQSKQKDYYKILGVARDADQKTIKKALYVTPSILNIAHEISSRCSRTAAKTAHPDKGGSEAKMAAVNEAYEVLLNPELRQRFDNGEDPNDPMAGQGGHPFHAGAGGHPFAQFFQQAPGGGFQGGGFPGGGQWSFQFGG